MNLVRHPSIHTEWASWSEDQVLHIISVYSNPFRFRNRRITFQNFIDHIKQAPNVMLHVVEVAFGDRPFEVTSIDDPNCVQLRTKDVLWVKENAINIAVLRLPPDWKYAGYVDGDFHCTRHDWALEAVHQLQHYDWVQLFSGYGFMSSDHRPVWNRPSFAYAYHNYFDGTLDGHVAKLVPEGYCPPDPNHRTSPGAVGGAWAWTKEAYYAANGLLETCILGAADWYMAYGLIGRDTEEREEKIYCDPPYTNSIREWETNAYAACQGNIGYVDNFVLHEWHGDIRKRGYDDRWQILRDNHFDPGVDIVKDDQGLFKWAGNKPKLRDAVNRYFLSRGEDSSQLTYTALY